MHVCAALDHFANALNSPYTHCIFLMGALHRMGHAQLEKQPQRSYMHACLACEPDLSLSKRFCHMFVQCGRAST